MDNQDEIINWGGLSSEEKGNYWIQGNKRVDEDIRYFTPSIEDIRVGYECEIDPAPKTGSPENWSKLTISKVEEIRRILEYPETIRVPYLTKEQIGAEGWTLVGSKDYLLYGYDVLQNFHNAMEKGDYVIQGRSLFGSQRHMKIFDRDDQEGAHCIFEGKCPDINTFRYICKLLGI